MSLPHVPPGWYPSRADGPHRERFWDATSWTTRARFSGFAAEQHVPVPTPAPAPPHASELVGEPQGARVQAAAGRPGGSFTYRPPAPQGVGPPPGSGAWHAYGPTPGGWSGQAPPAVPRTNGLAIASLVLGILWIYWIGSVLAVVFGHVALRQIRKANGWQEGRGIAIAGAILGWVGVAILAVLLILLASVSDDLDDYDDPYDGAIPASVESDAGQSALTLPDAPEATTRPSSADPDTSLGWKMT